MLYQLFIINLLLPIARHDTITIFHGSSYNGSFKARRTRHGYVVGGLPRLQYYLNGNREMSAFIIAGNFIRLPYTRNVARVLVERELLSKLEPTVMTFGHNEFNLNNKNYNLLFQKKTFSIISTNIELPNTSQNHTIQKTNIVIMSYVPEEFEELPLASGKEIQGMTDTLNEQIQRYKDQYPSKNFLFIASGCAGFDIAQHLAYYVKEIDIVISGCSPTMMWNDGEPPEGIKKNFPYPMEKENKARKTVLIGHTYGTTRFLGKLILNIDATGTIQSHIGRMIYLTYDTPEDEEAKKLVEKLDEIEIAHSRVYLNASCANSECKMGNVIADAFVHYKSNTHQGEYWTDTPIGLVAAGNIKKGIEVSGDNSVITMEELNLVFTKHHVLVTTEVTGDCLRKTVSHYVDKATAGNGLFLQVSGLYIRYNVRKRPKKRLVTLMARCDRCEIPTYYDIKMKSKYRVVTTKDIYQGKLKHVYFAKEAVLLKQENVTDYQVLQKYMKETKFIRAIPDERIDIQTELNRAQDLKIGKTYLVVTSFVSVALVARLC